MTGLVQPTALALLRLH